jgi:hypothetical protein
MSTADNSDLTCNSCSHSYETEELGCIKFLRCDLDGRGCFGRCDQFSEKARPAEQDGGQGG